MDALRDKLINSKAEVFNAITQAGWWELQGGANEQTTEYVQTTHALLTYPINLQHSNNLRFQAAQLYKAQATRACVELERLLAMNYMQKARLEASATRDNWARDTLGIVDANIRTITISHDKLLLAARGRHY